jgi:hypothetical protein
MRTKETMPGSMCLPLALCLLCASVAAHADEIGLDVLLASGFETAPPTVFRIGSMVLRDPHVYATVVFFCVDSTDAINEQIQQQLDADEDEDGFYDASALAVFRPLDASGQPGMLENRAGICTTESPPQCAPAGDPPVPRWYAAFDLGPPTVCLGALPDTTSGYSPPVPQPDGSCFTTTPVDTTFAFGKLSVPLWDTQYAAPFPSTTGSTGGGLLRGFLREADADELVLDVDGQNVVLSSLLPDGSGSCATNIAHGKDNHRGEPGWWMYLEYGLDAASASGF